jgi:hypothetical protein
MTDDSDSIVAIPFISYDVQSRAFQINKEARHFLEALKDK